MVLPEYIDLSEPEPEGEGEVSGVRSLPTFTEGGEEDAVTEPGIFVDGGKAHFFNVVSLLLKSSPSNPTLTNSKAFSPTCTIALTHPIRALAACFTRERRGTLFLLASAFLAFSLRCCSL